MLNRFTALVLFSTLTINSYADDWYKANAQPNLVVRASPSVTGDKLGNVPYGGKIKVLEKLSGQDSIGGRTGQWAKVQWQDKTGYVFDAFMIPMEAEKPASTSTHSGTNSASADDTEWFKSNAEPSLVVRSKPDVTGDKIGNVPFGGKVKVLAVVGKRESISGRLGRWVKIQWQDTTGYAFDAYLEPATQLRTGVNSTSASSDIDREIAMQLGLFNLLAESKGYKITHDVKQGKLPKGETAQYSVNLTAGTNYEILTACDKNCDDLDAALIDENNNRIDADMNNDALPSVKVTPKWTGKFTLQIKMQSCSAEPCHYGITIFGK